MKSGGFSSKVGLIISLRPLVWLAAYYDGIPRR